MVADLYLLILLLLNMTEPVFQEDDSKLEVQKRETELLIVSHDILGKEYELDGVSFTVLGIQPVFYDPQEEEMDLPLNIFTVTDIQSQKVPVIPFQGGMAYITKIQIDDEVVAGYKNILDGIHELCDLPRVDPVTGMYTDLEGTCWMPAQPLGELLGFISRYKIQNFKLSSTFSKRRIISVGLKYFWSWLRGYRGPAISNLNRFLSFSETKE